MTRNRRYRSPPRPHHVRSHVRKGSGVNAYSRGSRSSQVNVKRKPSLKKDKINAILKQVKRLEKKEAQKRYGTGEEYLSCEEVVEIAYPIFKKEGFDVKRVVGDVKNQSHAWLETKDLIIDPTSDQFPLPSITNKNLPKSKIYVQDKY